MGYLGRRIGKSQDTGNPTADGTGGGILDLFTNGYFQRQGNVFNAPGSSAFAATGGNIVPSATAGNGYTYHIFVSNGDFAVSGSPSSVEMLLVAAGGQGIVGGGGAGGIRNITSIPVSVGPNPIVVGTQTLLAQPVPATTGNGENSTAFGYTSVGGGRGGSSHETSGGSPAINGGSGGGSGNYAGTHGLGNTPPQPGNYGNSGGTHPPNSETSSGGGGAGGAGGSSPSTFGGNGQPFPAYAYPIITPGIPAPMQPTFGPAVGPTGLYGGGGAGGNGPSNSGPYLGGPGGGAARDTAAVNGTGGGGGGSWGGTAGRGGDGIVIIRYLG